MQPTTIKINKSPNRQNELTKNLLNLNDSSNKPRLNNKIKKYLWLLLAMVLIEGAGLAWLYLQKPISPYFKALPPNAIFSSYFDQTSLVKLLKNNIGWPPITWGDNELKSWLSKRKIGQPEQILKLFADQMALAVDQNENWLILAMIKAPSNVFQQAQYAAEQTLKQDYNLISESYRQISITQIKPLNQRRGNLFYARANSYFILTNSNEIIKATIDRIIK